jgi:ABC-type transport system involved in multi-copper enzyme maturation permease subunit
VKTVGHIFAKDVRHLRWPLLAWLAIVVGRIAATAAISELTFSGGVLQVAVENVSALLTIVDVLMLALIVSWLVHDEPLTGADAFWLTRPIHPARLMTAKLAFAATFLVIAPALGQALGIAILTRTAGDAARVLPAVLFTQATWVAVFTAFATLTPSLTLFLLTMAAGIATIVMAVSMNTTLLFMVAESNTYHESMMPNTAASLVSAWLLLAAALAVVASQYSTRRLKQSWFIGIGGVIVSLSIGMLLPWPVGVAAEPDPGPWSQDATRVAAVIDRDAEPYISDAFMFRRGVAPKKQIAIPIHLTGVPPAYSSRSTAVRGRLEFPDGQALESAQAISMAVRREGGDDGFDNTKRLQAALGGVRLLPPPGDLSYTQWPVVLTVTDSDYERYAEVQGRLTATMHVFLQETREAAAMPLHDGTSTTVGSARFEVRRMLRRQDGCSVLIRQSVPGAFDRSGMTRSFEFALRNVQRGEALVGDTDRLMERPILFGGWSIGVDTTSRLVFSDLIVHYPSRGAPNGTARIDAAWLDGADLAVVETRYIGRVTRSLAIDGFRMRRQLPQ